MNASMLTKQIIDLEKTRENYNKACTAYKMRIVICAGTGCMANGAMSIYNKFREVIAERGLKADVVLEKEEHHHVAHNDKHAAAGESQTVNNNFLLVQSGCQGFCQMGPLVTIYPQNILYTKVKVSDVEEIVDRTLQKGESVDRLLYECHDTKHHVKDMNKIPFYERQKRIMLKLCGHINVNDVDEYIANGGYFMARKAVLEMTAEQICKEILDSGLRGRGGGGFPTGRKWELTRINESDTKYIICNGDEGDPGAFMDRCVMEGNPHSVLEGMIIAAMAVNASIGMVYVRTEYPLAVQRLKKAIKSARENGILGENIFGSGKKFDIEVIEGAGAFVCGEETALIASIEGHRGMPTMKPPFPAEKGLFGKPTVINNVETLATIPVILEMGAAKYRELGTETSKGTKTFALTGHVANTGLIEVPFGTTLREIVGDIGGGVLDDEGNNCGVDFKAVQIGGPSGGCLTKEHLDLPLDYDNLRNVGAMVGSGGLVVMNQNTCMIQIARFFMQFTQNESCGKCVVCREGTRQMLALLDEIIEGRADAQTLELLEELAETVRIGSLCGLGKTAPNPVLSTLEYFRDEYNAHVFDKRCPTGNCEALKTYRIIAEKCKACGLCAKKCPVRRLKGQKVFRMLLMRKNV